MCKKNYHSAIVLRRMETNYWGPLNVAPRPANFDQVQALCRNEITIRHLKWGDRKRTGGGPFKKRGEISITGPISDTLGLGFTVIEMCALLNGGFTFFLNPFG